LSVCRSWGSSQATKNPARRRIPAAILKRDTFMVDLPDSLFLIYILIYEKRPSPVPEFRGF
jgi:hypothetical protein